MFFPLSGPAGELCAVSSPGTTGGTTGGTAPGLDLSGLDSAVRGLFSSSLASSTQKVYQSDSRRYRQFCSAYKVPVPFPVSKVNIKNSNGIRRIIRSAVRKWESVIESTVSNYFPKAGFALSHSWSLR